jgi:hypothetical protein
MVNEQRNNYLHLLSKGLSDQMGKNSCSGFIFALRRGYRIAATVMLFITMLACWNASSVLVVHAQSAGQFPITTMAYGKCLDADANTQGVNGTKIQIWDCVGDSNQQWKWQNCQTNGACELVSTAYGKCLDADANTQGIDGTKVQLWDCVGGTNQYWIISNALRNTYISLAYGKCLDADANTQGVNGTKVQLWDCIGGTNQQWSH